MANPDIELDLTAPPDSPATPDLSVDAAAVLADLSTTRLVAVPLAALAHRVKLTQAATLDACRELERQGLACLWSDLDDSPLVTLSKLAADRLGWHLSECSTRWIAAREKELRRKAKVRKTPSGCCTYNECDLGQDGDPITLDDLPAVEIEPSEGAKLTEAFEAADGRIRPGLILMGGAWPLPGQDRGPQAPPLDPADDPRANGQTIRLAAPCAACGGRPLGKLTILKPPKLKRRAIVEPAKVVDSCEACAVCDRAFGDKPAAKSKARKSRGDRE